MSLEHGSRDGLLSPEILQTTSPSSGRHLPTSRWLPPSGYKLCSRCSLSSRRTSQSGPSSKARPEVSTVLLVTLRVSLAVSSPLQLDAEGTHEYLILALQIQGICSSSHIRPVIIKGTDAGGVLWVYGGLARQAGLSRLLAGHRRWNEAAGCEAGQGLYQVPGMC